MEAPIQAVPLGGPPPQFEVEADYRYTEAVRVRENLPRTLRETVRRAWRSNRLYMAIKEGVNKDLKSLDYAVPILISMPHGVERVHFH